MNCCKIQNVNLAFQVSHRTFAETTIVILYADIGNQYFKWSLGRLLGQFSSTLSGLEEYFERNLADFDDVTDAYFVSVARREVAERFSSLVESRWNFSPREVVPVAEQCGVKNCYKEINQLGADRWAALIGAWNITLGATIVIDCGTAVTVDALSADGEFIGGSIMPGIRLSHEALHRRAPGIIETPRLDPTIPAQSTEQAVSSGVVHAVAGGIETLIEKYQFFTGSGARLMITGGDADLIIQHSARKFECVPNLVLKGLTLIAESST